MGQKKTRRPVIGVLASGIADTYTMQTCRGIVMAAKKENIDVVILPGKYVDRDLSANEIRFEYQYNSLFAYAKEQRVDAVIITAGCICCYADAQKTKEFIQQFKDIPCVLLGYKEEGFLSVNYDNYQGIKEGLEYLIRQLKCKNIAMMGGPAEDTDSIERKNTFFQVMRENHMEVNEDHYFPMTLTMSRKEEFEAYLDAHTDLEAIVCVNDDAALAVYDAMKERNMVPGKDIHVMGYDNTLQSAQVKPSLSTVMANAVPLGEKALRLVLDLLYNKNPKSIVVPTKFIQRESFGKEAWHGKNVQFNRLHRAYVEYYYNEIFYRYEIEHQDNTLRMLFHTIMGVLIDTYENGVTIDSMEEGLTSLINGFFKMGAIRYAENEKLMDHINEIYKLMIQRNEDEMARRHIFQMFTTIYSEIVLAKEQIQTEKMAKQEQKNYDIKMYVSKNCQFDKGTDQNYETLISNLDWLGVQNADLFIYSSPMMMLQEDVFQVPSSIFHMAILRNGKVRRIVQRNKRISTKELFRTDLFQCGNNVKVAFPVYNNEYMYGLVVCDMSDDLYEYGEFFAGQLGSSAKMLHLLKCNEAIQTEYERTLVALRENNIALDVLAKSDGLTGILNRRGFIDSAEKVLANNKQMEKRTLVSYIDMNNLKIVNDRFGHDEGDFSICKISQVLQNLFPEGVVGRIGGDEFSLICDYYGMEDGTDIVSKIYEAFSAYNDSSDKNYSVSVSAGVCVIEPDAKMELREAMGMADERLYLEKEKRVRSIAK